MLGAPAGCRGAPQLLMCFLEHLLRHRHDDHRNGREQERQDKHQRNLPEPAVRAAIYHTMGAVAYRIGL